MAGGGQTTGTVTLTGPAPAGGALVRLNGSMEGKVVTPPSVTVPAGSVSANFTITAPQVPAPYYVLIQASYSSLGVSHARLLEIVPGSGSPTLLAMGVNPTSVVGGASTTGTVQLVVPAPPGGGVVTLTSDNPALVQVPTSVSVPAGNSATSFTITTSVVASFTTVRVDASAGGVTRSEFINLAANPNNPPAGLQAVTLGAGSVTGGTTATGTVVLSGSAPAGGVSVSLATSNSSVAQVPPVVTVPAGQSQAAFTVTTFAVSTNTVVTITGFQGSVTRSANLTVLSGSSVPTPGTPVLVSPADAATVTQPVTLDWNDASNAASYEIQVDDSSGFSAPLVSSLTSTASQTTVSGLAAVQHWWRVRAKNSAGVAGNWSASRRFTVGSGSPAALAIALSGVPATISRGQSFTATATVTNTGGSAASGLSVVVSFTPSDALQLQSPQGSTQSVATVAAGGSGSVAWQMRADRAGTATVTMTLRNSERDDAGDGDPNADDQLEIDSGFFHTCLACVDRLSSRHRRSVIVHERRHHRDVAQWRKLGKRHREEYGRRYGRNLHGPEWNKRRAGGQPGRPCRGGLGAKREREIQRAVVVAKRQLILARRGIEQTKRRSA